MRNLTRLILRNPEFRRDAMTFAWAFPVAVAWFLIVWTGTPS